MVNLDGSDIDDCTTLSHVPGCFLCQAAQRWRDHENCQKHQVHRSSGLCTDSSSTITPQPVNSIKQAWCQRHTLTQKISREQYKGDAGRCTNLSHRPQGSSCTARPDHANDVGLEGALQPLTRDVSKVLHQFTLHTQTQTVMHRQGHHAGQRCTFQMWALPSGASPYSWWPPKQARQAHCSPLCEQSTNKPGCNDGVLLHQLCRLIQACQLHSASLCISQKQFLSSSGA